MTPARATRSFNTRICSCLRHSPRVSRLAVGLALAVVLVISFFVFGTTVTTCTPNCTVEVNRPDWFFHIVSFTLWIGLVVAIGLAFLPFRRSQLELPAFFRAHFFVPALFMLWVVSGSFFPFSPHQLTRTMPDYLLGANDWGTGNIYTYTKLTDWLALLAGCVACVQIGDNREKMWRGFTKRLYICRPHLLAAAILHFCMGILDSGLRSELGIDLFLLFAWLIAGFSAIALSQSLSEACGRRWVSLLAWPVAFGWLFVPVALFRP